LCSIVEPEDFVGFYLDKGFSGMVITDHFYHGNTAVDRRLPWDMFIDEFCQGYLRAKAEGDKHDFKVFFGFEQKFCDGNDEYIVLGITPDWLKAHPEIRDMERAPFFKKIREAGGYTIQAHPFRERYYISDIRLSLDYVDAIEVLNIGDEKKHSRRAYEYAKNVGIPMTAGSDIHSIENFPVVAGVALEQEVNTIEELIDAIKCGRAQISPRDRFEEIKALPLDSDLGLSVLALENGELKNTDNYFAKK
jgi:hypothetical protein